MKTIINIKVLSLFIFALIISVNLSYGQLTQNWVAQFNGAGNTGELPANSIATDNLGHVYVTCATHNSSLNIDNIVTIKYDASQNIVWTALFDPTIDAGAAAITVDNSGNVYVVGTSYSFNASFANILTIKYNSAGVQQWYASYNGPSQFSIDHGTDIVVDASGNSYVTGKSEAQATSSLDYVVVKYSETGSQIWAYRYDYNHSIDTPYDIEIDNSANIYVAGESFTASAKYDYAVLKLNSDGALLWVNRYHKNRNDKAYSVCLDKNKNVYVTGLSEFNYSRYGDGEPQALFRNEFSTVSYTPNGQLRWIKRFYNSKYHSFGLKIKPSRSQTQRGESVFVTGLTANGYGGEDIVTIKYDENGTQNWIRFFQSGLVNQPAALEIDPHDNVYVGGITGNFNTHNYLIVQYDPNGNLKWSGTYDGGADDQAYSMKLGRFDNLLYISGIITNTSGNLDIGTVQYGILRGDGIPAGENTVSNFPNPFNPTTKIKYELSQNTNVKLSVFNLLGQKVVELYNGYRTAGTYTADFNGSELSSGTYYYRLETDNTVETKMMQLIK